LIFLIAGLAEGPGSPNFLHLQQFLPAVGLAALLAASNGTDLDHE